jgi:DNA-binding response OmpR family regulator
MTTQAVDDTGAGDEFSGRTRNDGLLLYALDDDAVFGAILTAQLRRLGIRCEVFTSASKMLHALSQTQHTPDAFIIDFHLGSATDNGLTVCRTLHSLLRSPVIMLTGDSGIDKAIACLDAGASQYVTKPCDIYELCARIRASLRASSGTAKPSTSASPAVLAATEKEVVVGELRVNLAARSVSYGARPENACPVPYKEAQVLAMLVRAPDHVVQRRDAFFAIYGSDMPHENRTIDVSISRLRKLLKKINAPFSIRSVWGRGYRLIPQ